MQVLDVLLFARTRSQYKYFTPGGANQHAALDWKYKVMAKRVHLRQSTLSTKTLLYGEENNPYDGFRPKSAERHYLYAKADTNIQGIHPRIPVAIETTKSV